MHDDVDPADFTDPIGPLAPADFQRPPKKKRGPRKPKVERAPAPPRDLASEAWFTGPMADRRAAPFTHLIRSSDDPERADIRLLPEAQRDRLALWRRSLAKRPLADFREPLLSLLRGGPPRTFNAIGVLLFEKTADLLVDLPPDLALWSLVADQLVEHTAAAPILFRVTAAGREASPEVVAAPSPEALAFARPVLGEPDDDEPDDDEPDDEP